MAKDRRRNADAAMDARPGRSGEEGGLTRWSRRKRLARAAREAATPVPPADGGGPPAANAAAEKTDADMPPIESLHEDSDYAAFLSPKVSETLRRTALRKLFQLPQFNFRDGLDDYAEDYRNFAPLGGIITADMRHHMERELEALKERQQTGGGGKPDNEEPAVASGKSAVEPAAESRDAPGIEPAPVAATSKKSRHSKRAKT